MKYKSTFKKPIPPYFLAPKTGFSTTPFNPLKTPSAIIFIFIF